MKNFKNYQRVASKIAPILRRSALLVVNSRHRENKIMKRWKISVAMDGLATGLPLSTSHKFRVATLSFLFGAICLCLVPGLWAQSAKAPASASGSNNQPGFTGASTGCGYSPTAPAPIFPQRRSGEAQSGSRQPSLVLISAHNDQDSDGDSDHPVIVGLWKFAFTATTPFSGPFDAGYVSGIAMERS